MAEIAVIGCGQAGLVVAASFASLGHRVMGIDVDAERIAACRRGIAPVREPGLSELLQSGLREGRLTFADRYPARIEADFVFIAVDTPPSASGACDLKSVRSAIASMAPALRDDAIVINKSTSPIGTCEELERLLRAGGMAHPRVVSNPEFLQEGDAIRNFTRPDRIILGGEDQDALARVQALYQDFRAPIVVADSATAEMVKYASNAFLALKISFINEIATICDVTGADVRGVARGMGLDERIGPRFLQAGIGWGGSCFPKDLSALEYHASLHGVSTSLLRGTVETNRIQRRQVVRKLQSVLGTLSGARVVILGASFKPHTSDIRDSPALEVAEQVRLAGADVRIVDPHVARDAAVAEQVPFPLMTDVEEAARDADALVLATEWPEFLDLPLARIAKAMRRAVIVDGRNALDDEAVRQAGFTYRCIGRPRAEACADPDEGSFAPSTADVEWAREGERLPALVSD